MTREVLPIRAAKILVHALRLAVGYAHYLATGKTPVFAFRSMSSLFCRTGGRSSDLLSWIIARTRGKFRNLPACHPGSLLSAAEAETAIHSLRSRGYYALETRLDDDVCARLLDFSLAQSCLLRPMDDDPGKGPARARYDRRAPLAARYDLDGNDLLGNRDVQDLCSDLSLVALAQRYLDSKPLLDVVSMWWHTDYLDHPDSQAAQYFHFDMDRPKWLKVFVFLTDVTSTSGPHTFVTGSHRTGAIPHELLSKGQARLSDEEVLGAYGKDAMIEFIVPRGTVMLEDTRGLHKGRHVEQGDRLVLQLQFSNSLFGMQYPQERFATPSSERLSASMSEFPDIYRAYRDH